MKASPFLFLWLSLIPGLLLGSPGEPDYSFGPGGTVVTPAGPSGNAAESIVEQPDGKLVVAGYAQVGGNYDLRVIRYLPDGALDASFGTGGIVATHLVNRYEPQTRLALQKDGKFVLAANISSASSAAGDNFQADFAVVRYTATGALDTTFHGTGIATTSFGQAVMYGMVLQPDGKIVVVGEQGRALTNPTQSSLAIARFNGDGSLDSTFNGTGQLTTSFFQFTRAKCVAVQSDGKIVVGGTTYHVAAPVGGILTPAPELLMVARYTAAGAPDASFGPGGVPGAVLSELADEAESVLIQGDGAMVAIGQSNNGFRAVANGFKRVELLRFQPAGTVDESFGVGGVAGGPLGSAVTGAAALQPDGKIVFETSFDPVQSFDWATVRYTATGAPDPSFGYGGSVSGLAANALALQSDGRIVIAGGIYHGPPGGIYSDAYLAFGVSRLLGAFEGPATTDFDGNGAPDLVTFNPATGRTQVKYLYHGTVFKTANGPQLPPGWQLVKVADFNGDGGPDYVLFLPAGKASAGTLYTWHLNGTTLVHGAILPWIPPTWQLVSVADTNGDGHPDLLLFDPGTRRIAAWSLRGETLAGGTRIAQNGVDKVVPAGWRVVGALDCNGDGKADLVLYNSTTGQTAFWYLNGTALVSEAAGPTLPAGSTLAGVADFNRDGEPDFLVLGGTPGIAIWYLDLDGTAVSHQAGVSATDGLPVLANGYNLVAP